MKTLKERQIALLKKTIKWWNFYRRITNNKTIDFSYVDLRGEDLRGTNLRNVNLKNANLKNTNLARTDLTGANLEYADLINTKLEFVDLTLLKQIGIRTTKTEVQTQTFKPWSNTTCDKCGDIFQITRAESKTVTGSIICSDCKIYEDAYNCGVNDTKESQQPKQELSTKIKVRILDSPESFTEGVLLEFNSIYEAADTINTCLIQGKKITINDKE